MKRIVRSKSFLKAYKKRIAPFDKLDRQFAERTAMFLSGVRDNPINDYPLTSKMQGLRAYSVTGDVRVVYRETSSTYELLDVGTHNQVYK